MIKLKSDLNEIENKIKQYKQEMFFVRWREYEVKFKLKEMFEKILEKEEKIRKIEDCIYCQNG